MNKKEDFKDMSDDFSRGVAELLNRDGRYPESAYRFVASAVDYTVGKLPEHRHVSALELLEGTRDFARQEFGAVAGMVLNHYGLVKAEDIGHVVYLLISVGLLSSSEEDSPEDFCIDFELVPAEKTVPTVYAGELCTID